MFKKFSRCLVHAKLNFACLPRWFETSALFVPGDRAQETYSVLVPYLDLDTRFQNKEKLEENVKLRRIKLHVQSLKKLWDLYRLTETNKKVLEGRRVEIAQKIKELHQGGSKENEAEISKYMLEGKLVKEDLKVLMRGLWGLEKQAVIRALALPNDLDEDTPSRGEKPVHVFGEKPNFGPGHKSSVELGKLSHLVDYHEASCYFLRNEAAVFELEVQHYFAEELRNIGFVQFGNADFAWSVVVEGCGKNHRDPNSVFILQDDDPAQTDLDRRLHLVGGASLASFCAFHAKHLVDHRSFPLKYFALGRKYEPSGRNSGENDLGGLFDSWQASAVELFIATSDNSAAKREFRMVSEAIIRLYERLGHHFKVVYLPPNLLHGWESLRASFQMYFPSKEAYVEVGNISLSGSYVSKRLLMCYSENKRERQFLSLVSGTVLSVPKLLACVLENSTHLPQVPISSKITM